MVNEDLGLAFARVLLAAAWADNDLAADEVASLRTSLRQLPAILGTPALTDEALQALEPFLYVQVTPEQRAVWINDLRLRIADEDELRLIVAGIDRLMRADRVLTPAERLVADEIRTALEDLDFSSLARFARAVRRAILLFPHPTVRDAERHQ